MAGSAKKAATRAPRRATAPADGAAGAAVTRAQVAGALDTATAAVDKIGDMAAADGTARR